MTERGSATILIVEDDENLRLALQDNLESEGYRTRAVGSGEEGLRVVEALGMGGAAAEAEAEAEAGTESTSFDLMILDIMLPGIDGYRLCEKLRDMGVDASILMLTARTLEDDLVRGFEAGADDYLAKPYRLRELLARVRALLRRRAKRPTSTLCFAGFTLDQSARTLTDSSGAPVALTRTEFDLLGLLLGRQGEALARQEILNAVWGRDLVVEARTVDNFISNLKRKLKWSRKSTFRIETVRGVGYRMEVDDGGAET